MNVSTIVPQTTFNLAYKLGVEDAKDGNAFAPEMYFAHPDDMQDYAAGFESVRGASVITAQFTHSAVPAPVVVEAAPVAAAIVVPQYKRNVGKEYVRRSDSNVAAIFKAAERHARQFDAMMAADPSGQLLWAV